MNVTNLFASAGMDGAISIWDEKGYLVNKLKGHSAWINCLAFNHQMAELISCSTDATIKVWDIATGEVKHTLTQHKCWVNSIFLNDNYLVSGDASGMIAVWDLKFFSKVNCVKFNFGAIWSICGLSDINSITFGSFDGGIRSVTIPDLNNLKVIGKHNLCVTSLSLDNLKNCIYSSSYDSTIIRWDIKDNFQKLILCGHSERIWSISHAYNVDLFSSASADGTVKIWRNDKICCEVSCPDLPTVSIFNSKGELLIIGLNDGRIGLLST